MYFSIASLALLVCKITLSTQWSLLLEMIKTALLIGKEWVISFLSLLLQLSLLNGLVQKLPLVKAAKHSLWDCIIDLFYHANLAYNVNNWIWWKSSQKFSNHRGESDPLTLINRKLHSRNLNIQQDYRLLTWKIKHNIPSS